MKYLTNIYHESFGNDQYSLIFELFIYHKEYLIIHTFKGYDKGKKREINQIIKFLQKNSNKLNAKDLKNIVNQYKEFCLFYEREKFNNEK